jgi:hypothetical protein
MITYSELFIEISFIFIRRNRSDRVPGFGCFFYTCDLCTDSLDLIYELVFPQMGVSKTGLVLSRVNGYFLILAVDFVPAFRANLIEQFCAWDVGILEKAVIDLFLPLLLQPSFVELVWGGHQLGKIPAFA